MNDEIKKIIIDAVAKAGYDIPVGFSVEEPPRQDMGDFATNVALLAAKSAGKSPREVAQKISSSITSEQVLKTEVAGPGFINIFIKPSSWIKAFADILAGSNKYGESDEGKGKCINVEYISANPTGPVHIGNARGGPIGEAIANLYQMLGYKVIRSFYVNDIGGQIDKLAQSFYYWYEKSNGEDPIFPEGGYPGDYVREATEKVIAKYKKELSQLKDSEEFIAFFKDKGVREMVERIRREVALLGIEFDDWIYQSELEANGNSDEIMSILENRGAVATREGATWFKNPDDPEFIDDEAVLRKSDAGKTLTYFADDIACHKYKVDQGADMMIDLWGSNHHGHIARMKAAMQAIGIDPHRLQILLYQNVRIKNGEEIIKMSKREGNFVLLADVIKFGVGADVFKYFVLNQNNNTPFDFDVKLAMEKSEKNPVYYVQYAYARINSILRKANDGKGGQGIFKDAQDINYELLKHPRELALIKELVKLPDIVKQAGSDLQMQAFPHYAYRVASLFHEFYNDCQVIGEKNEIEKARLALVEATRIVLKKVLDICDITAPEKM